MILPHNCLILVTDGRKMLMLRNKGSGDRIELQTEQHENPRRSQGQGNKNRRTRLNRAERGIWQAGDGGA